MKNPGKLYGRDADIASLDASFKRVGSGPGEVLLIRGQSGVGKSALAQQLQGSVRALNGYFIQGKFDQYRRNIPYFGLRQALSQLLRQLLSEDSLQRQRLRADILEAVGNQGQVLVDLVPNFELLLGVQPALGDFSPQEARHRLAGVCRNLLKAICLPEHPVVLFIDDWQWADVASCELLKILGVGVELRYLLLIVSYRDDEVDTEHPLTYALEDLRNKATPLESIDVETLTAADVREIAADTLKQRIEDADGLAKIVHTRTLGNPFFVHSFFWYLRESNLLWFDKARACWRWRIDGDQAGLPGSLVELFARKLLHLDAASRTLFSLAACLGNRFDLDDLSLISGHDPMDCKARLFSSESTGLLLPPTGGGGGATPAGICEPEICEFLHDSVQQAAHSLIEREQLPGTLLRIGRQLLASLPDEKLTDRLFEVVNDLNAGAHLIEHTAEQVRVIELNVLAARKAYAATAYRSALKFYRAADALLETPGLGRLLWRDHHELAVQLFEGRAVCEFQEGDRNEAEKCIQLAVANAGTPLGKARSLSILIVHCTLLARYPEAIVAGRQALKELGIDLPETDYSQARDHEIAMVREMLGSRAVESLSDLPVMSDPEMLMASRILIAMGPPCYRSHQRLWSVIVPKVVNLTLRHGNIPQVGYSHAAFGGLLGWVDDDYATAKAFGELATSLMTRTFTSASDQSVFYLMIGSSIRHWFEHLSAGSRDYADAYETGLRSGNLQYAGYAFGHNMYCRFYQGIPLASLIQETRRSLAFARTRVNHWAIDLLEGGLNVFGALTGESHGSAVHESWSEQDYLQRLEQHRNIQVTCIYKILKTFSLLVHGEHTRALALSDETEPLIYTVGTQGLLPWPEHVFARMLILTALYAQADAAQQVTWRRELDQMMSRLRIWAENCPQNFGHKQLLIAAELARIDGRHADAMELFDAAIEGARIGNFLQWQAVANERACNFWMEQDKERIAQVYWQQAYECFDRWGASIKVRSMEAAYKADLEVSAGAEPLAKKNPLKQPSRTGHSFAQRQILQLRAHVRQLQQGSAQVATATQARELADAMERARMEIVERKHAEEVLRTHDLVVALDAAQAANRAKDAFLATVSHELRTPLNAIIGFSSLLLQEEVETCPADRRKQLAIIKSSGEQLLALVVEILNFSSIEAGHTRVDLTTVSLHPLLEEQCQLLEAQAIARHLELGDVECAADIEVVADAGRLRQVMRNLLTNAIKFSDEGHVRVRARRSGTMVRVEVEDSGIGIPLEQQAELFRPFQRIVQKGAQLREGTGLGLAITKRLVEAMGGAIGVTSELGRGSTFWFELRLALDADAYQADVEGRAVLDQGLGHRKTWAVSGTVQGES